MSMDISTGDVITPDARIHVFTDMLEPEKKIELLSYPIETVLAEKLETILSRGVENTRPRDFYDVYMLAASDYDKKILRKAFEATSKHRGSYEKIQDHKSIIGNIQEDRTMNQRWKGYQKIMPYAEGISFVEVLNVIQKIMKSLLPD